jgi:hypothetical protein
MSERANRGSLPLLTVIVHALAACAPPSKPVSEVAGLSVGAPTKPAHPLRPIFNSADVAGQWDVVSFEGHRPRRLSGTVRAAYVDFGPSGVSLKMECNYTGRPGRVIEGRFVVEPGGDNVQTQIGCGPERGLREQRYFGFFERNPSVEFVSVDRVRLRAGQDELLLERPSLRRLSHLASSAELQGEWEMLEVSRFPPEGGVAGIGLSEASSRIVIEGDRLRIRGCQDLDMTFQYTGQGQLRKSGGKTLQAEPLGCSGVSDTADGTVLPKGSDAIRLIHADPLVEKVEDGVLLLSNGEYGLLISRVRD